MIEIGVYQEGDDWIATDYETNEEGKGRTKAAALMDLATTMERDDG